MGGMKFCWAVSGRCGFKFAELIQSPCALNTPEIDGLENVSPASKHGVVSEYPFVNFRRCGFGYRCFLSSITRYFYWSLM